MAPTAETDSIVTPANSTPHLTEVLSTDQPQIELEGSDCIPVDEDVSLVLDKFSDFPLKIGQFLNAGGALEVLSQELLNAGIAGEPIIVAADDATANGKRDIITSVIDRASNIFPQPSYLLIYVCQDGRFNLAYQLTSQEIEGDPKILELTDMDSKGGVEVLISDSTCGAHTCFERIRILSWNGSTFVDHMGGDTSELPYPEVDTQDPDGDGILDLYVTATGFGSVGAGPPRPLTVVYSFSELTGRWEPTDELLGASDYRIHVLHDADRAARSGSYEAAQELYERVIEDPELQSWGNSNEDWTTLSAYARYKLMVTNHLLEDSTRAQELFDALESSHAPGEPQYVFVELADTFRDAYIENGVGSACQAVREFVNLNEDKVLDFFYYGYGNPQYQAEDICPFN
jgi:hypothetical protein